MALSRRAFLGGASLFLGAGSGCLRFAGPQARSGPAYEELYRVGRASDKGSILVLMPGTSQTREVWTGLTDELGRDYELVSVRVESRNDDGIIAAAIERSSPKAIVLMNNPTVAAYAEYQHKHADHPFPPAIIVMTSFLDGQQRYVAQSTGIYYEVPLITVVTNLRKLIATPIDRIGVVRRAQLADFVHRQAELATHERILVEEEEVGASPNASELKRAIRRVRQRADALWVLNDDRLLTPRLIADGWIPGVSERPWIPTIVGAAPLVSPVVSFGTFAVLPDHTALGVQAASLLFDLADSGWSIQPGVHIQLPLSTTTTVDLVQARERFALREEALAHVDRILK
jgi:hypothetical protein